MIDDSTPGPHPRHGQVHRLPPLRDGVQRDPGRGRPVRPGPRLHDRHRPGVRARTSPTSSACSAASAPPSAPWAPSPSTTRSTRSGTRSTIPTKTVVVQTAPAIRAALGECFDYAPGTLVTGKMVAALRRLGFDAVFDTNFTADLTIMEEGTELLMRLKKALVDGEDVALPSCSRAARRAGSTTWSTSTPTCSPTSPPASRPQQMFGALAKTYYAEKIGMKPEDMVVVSVMPCTAKKFEAPRPEMNASGVRDVDVVLTTRELGAHDQAGRHRLPQPARREDGRAAGHQHRRGRHLRQHRRRHGGRPAHGLGDRHRDALPLPEPARRAHRGPRGRQGGDASRSRAPRATGPSSRASTSRSPWPTGSATPRRSSTRSRAAKPSTTSSRS